MKQLNFMEWLMLGLLALSIVGFGYQGKATVNSGKSVLKHQVVVTFRTDAPSDIIRQVDASFAALSKLPHVVAFESHVVEKQTPNTPVRHLYLTTFKDKAGLEAYGQSKAHQDHIRLGAEYIASVEAYDYFAH